MNSIQRKRETGRARSSKKSENFIGDPKWHKENQILQAAAEENSRLHEEITKQSYADSAVQNAIQDKVCDLKDKAVKLAKTLESEKRKNIQLEAIIRHMKFVMEEEKKVEATHRDDMNFENMDNLTRKIKKLEYDLEQMYSKINDLNSKIRIQKNQIDTSRTQRVIDSTIFLKIQKQIVYLELQYKKLLIEKTKYEKEYNKNLLNYRKIRNDIEKQHTNINNRTSVDRGEEANQKENQFFEEAPEIQQAVKFTDITNISEGGKKKNVNSKRYSMYTEGKDEVNQELEIKVKKVFVETGLSSAEEFIEHLENIQKINDELFEEVNKNSDNIVAVKDQIQKSLSYRKNKKVRYYDKEPQMTKGELQCLNLLKFSAEIKHTDHIMQKQVEELNEFMKFKESKEFQFFTGKIDKSSVKQDSEENQACLDQIAQFFAKLGQKMTPLLSNYQDLKEKFSEEAPIQGQRQAKADQKDQTVDDIMSKIKRIEESEKIMVREEFKQEYQHLKRNGKPVRHQAKKKTTLIIKH